MPHCLYDSPDPTPYKSHPLYRFRRLIIINAVIGLFLHVLAIASSRGNVIVWVFGIIILLASASLALVDLFVWDHKKREEKLSMAMGWPSCSCLAERTQPCLVSPHDHHDRGNAPSHFSWFQSCPAHPTGPCPSTLQPCYTATTDQVQIHPHALRTIPCNDTHSPGWPLRPIMILDFLLAGLLAWWATMEIVSSPNWSYYYGDGASTVVRAYATLPTLVAAVLHAKCWWRAFRAREKEAWARQLGVQVCFGVAERRGRGRARGGYEEIVDRDPGATRRHGDGGTYTYRARDRGRDVEAGLPPVRYCRRTSCAAGAGKMTTAAESSSAGPRPGPGTGTAAHGLDLVGNTLRTAVAELNREARRALQFKAWPGPNPCSSVLTRQVSDPGETEPLLPRTRTGTECCQQHQEGIKPAMNNSGNNDDDDDDGRSCTRAPVPHAHAHDPTPSDLTPSSRSSSSSNRRTSLHDYDNNNDDGDDDDSITVVKKAAKNKTKNKNGRKTTGAREIEF